MKNGTMKIKCIKAEVKFRDFNCWIYLSVTYIPSDHFFSTERHQGGISHKDIEIKRHHWIPL